MAPVPLLLKLPLPLRMLSGKWWQARALLRRKLEMDGGSALRREERDKRAFDLCTAALKNIETPPKESDLGLRELRERECVFFDEAGERKIVLIDRFDWRERQIVVDETYEDFRKEVEKVFYSVPKEISPKEPDRYIKMIYYKYYHIMTPKDMLAAIYPEKLLLYFQGQNRFFGGITFLTGRTGTTIGALKDKLN